MRLNNDFESCWLQRLCARDHKLPQWESGGEGPSCWAILAIVFGKKQQFQCQLDDILNVFRAIRKYAKLLRFRRV